MTDARNRTAIRPFDPRAFLGQADTGITIEKYDKNQKIFSQGDAADTVFFIQRGKVKITVLSEHGKEAVVGILAARQFFGESCLDGAELRPRPAMRWKNA
jgi:CRP/FNR family transcriptional regulator, cyclic AMP receptor protein